MQFQVWAVATGPFIAGSTPEEKRGISSPSFRNELTATNSHMLVLEMVGAA